MPSAELYRLFKGEQKEVYVKSINQSTESNLKNGVVPLEEWRLKVDIILAGKVATRRYKMVQKPADVSGGSQSKTHKITSVMIKTILMKWNPYSRVLIFAARKNVGITEAEVSIRYTKKKQVKLCSRPDVQKWRLSEGRNAKFSLQFIL